MGTRDPPPRRARNPSRRKDAPDEKTYQTLLVGLTTALDEAAAKQPDPGRSDALRRLTPLTGAHRLRSRRRSAP